ncbi:MAG TPA: DUF2304 domain-containing protein [Novosphingobium sp.]|nr:DUF2304 domain-containing protein [Novosphingobium sp.]
MIFQAILVFSLGLLVIYAYFQWRRAPLVSLSVLVLAVVGMVLALAPDLSTKAAHLVGIGRGADLVIYCFVLIALGAIFNLHVKLRESEDNLTTLVRAVALLKARVAENGGAAAGDDD